MNKRITEISGLSSLVKDYNTFLVDLWGVIHNGINIFPGIIELLKRLKEEDKQVIFVTNAPRRSEVIRLQLQDFGISSNLFSFLIIILVYVLSLGFLPFQVLFYFLIFN